MASTHSTTGNTTHSIARNEAHGIAADEPAQQAAADYLAQPGPRVTAQALAGAATLKLLGLMGLSGGCAWVLVAGLALIMPPGGFISSAPPTAPVPVETPQRHLAAPAPVYGEMGVLRGTIARLTRELSDRREAYGRELLKLKAEQAVLQRRQLMIESWVRKTLGRSAPAAPDAPVAPGADAGQIQPAASFRTAGTAHSLTAGQLRVMDMLLDHAKNHAAKLRTALSTLEGGKTGPRKHRVKRASNRLVTAPMGGPFVGLRGPWRNAAPFTGMLAEMRAKTSQINKLKQSLIALPVARPTRVRARITSRFGPRRDPLRKRRAFHTGIDLAAPPGTRVNATAKGLIIKAGRMPGYGRMVTVKHKNGLTTRYAHLRRINVAVGDRVEAGDRIGSVGATGRTTGPHLHYETRRHGRPLDPARFMQAGKHVYEIQNRGKGF